MLASRLLRVTSAVRECVWNTEDTEDTEGTDNSENTADTAEAAEEEGRPSIKQAPGPCSHSVDRGLGVLEIVIA